MLLFRKVKHTVDRDALFLKKKKKKICLPCGHENQRVMVVLAALKEWDLKNEPVVSLGCKFHWGGDAGGG